MPSLSDLSLREYPVSASVIVTLAPAIAAPCSSIAVPRTEAVMFCAEAAREVPRMSARTASIETISRDLPIDSFAFEKRIFMRLPLEEDLREKTRKERELCVEKACKGLIFLLPRPTR